MRGSHDLLGSSNVNLGNVNGPREVVRHVLRRCRGVCILKIILAARELSVGSRSLHCCRVSSSSLPGHRSYLVFSAIMPLAGWRS